jgi:maltose alpha-D-glucosyltransferase/alpha-amylase
VLLDVYLLAKDVIQLGHDLIHRPEWAPIPIVGLLDLLGEPRGRA